jgi:hypothetical protein
MYQRGVGVEQDIGEALRLYALAAAQGDQDAKRCLAHVSDYIPCFRSYSAALPIYVAIAHAVTTWHLRRLAACLSRAPHPAPACSAAAYDSVEVTRTARLRVCSSGVASFLTMALAKSSAAKSACRHDRGVVCSWACSIAARLYGRRCIVVKASCYCTAVRWFHQPCDIAPQGALALAHSDGDLVSLPRFAPTRAVIAARHAFPLAPVRRLPRLSLQDPAASLARGHLLPM